jgi:hypothetical protein
VLRIIPSALLLGNIGTSSIQEEGKMKEEIIHLIENTDNVTALEIARIVLLRIDDTELLEIIYKILQYS